METLQGKLWDILYKGSGLDEIIQASADYIGNPIYILDSSNCIIAACQQIRTADSYLKESITRGVLTEHEFRSFKNSGILNEIYKSNQPFISRERKQADGQFQFIFAPIRLHNETIAFLCCINMNRAHNEADLEPLNVTAKAVSIELQKNRIYQDNRSSELGYQLLRAISNDPHSSGHRVFSGWSPKKHSYILYISADIWQDDDKTPSSIGFSLFKSLLPLDIIAWHENSLIALISLNEPFEPGQIKYDGIENLCSTHNLSAGYSAEIRDFSLCPIYYYEAHSAYMTGSLIKNDNCLHSFSLLYSRNIMRIAHDSLAPQCLYHPGIRILHELDRSEGSDYCHTLRVYLESLKDTPTCCKKLSIHKNTLYYRLNKIKEIIRDDLNSIDSIITFMLSFYALDMGLIE